MKSAIFLVAFLSCFAAQVEAQWQQSGGPSGGHINEFAVMGDNLFACSDGGGVFLSTDQGLSMSTNGATWSQSGLNSRRN